jgi:hypothetical protein
MSENINKMTCCGLSLKARVKPPHDLEPNDEEPDRAGYQDGPRTDAGPEGFHRTAAPTMTLNTSGA